MRTRTMTGLAGEHSLVSNRQMMDPGWERSWGLIENCVSVDFNFFTNQENGENVTAMAAPIMIIHP